MLAVSRKTGVSDKAGTDDATFLTAVANEGVHRVLLDTHIYVTKQNFALSAGTAEYSIATALATDVLAIVEIARQAGSTYGSLTREPTFDILRDRLGEVTGYPRQYSTLGADLIIFQPTPSESETLDVYGVPIPTAMSSGANDPSTATYGGIPVWAHKAIECWMQIQAYEKTRDFEAADRAERRYIAEIAKINRDKSKMGGRRPAPSRIGYPGKVRAGMRNDIYPDR
jgi:hypothetical protein